METDEIPGAGFFIMIAKSGEDNDPDTRCHSLRAPFAELLGRLGHGSFKNLNYFSDGSLSLSLVRCFGYYQRIMELESITDHRLGRPQLSMFLDADIESFIIRYRVTLNDLAFMLRRLYPENVRGLPGPKGGVHPQDREISIRDLEKFCQANPEFHPEMTEAFDRNRPWLHLLREQRDRLIHYKAKVFVFEEKDGSLEFAILSPAGQDPATIMPDGTTRIVTTPVFQFVHEQMTSFWRFLNEDVILAIEGYVTRNGLTLAPSFGNYGFSAYGIEIFKRNRKRLSE
jgi:hypothetical protein